MTYPLHVHWDKPNPNVCIHTAECRWCNHGHGVHNKTDERQHDGWVPAASYQAAWQIAQRFASELHTQARLCSKCHPQTALG